MITSWEASISVISVGQIKQLLPIDLRQMTAQFLYGSILWLGNFHMFILRSPYRAYDSRYLLICKHVFCEKIGKNIDTHTLYFGFWSIRLEFMIPELPSSRLFTGYKLVQKTGWTKIFTNPQTWLMQTNWKLLFRK